MSRALQSLLSRPAQAGQLLEALRPASQPFLSCGLLALGDAKSVPSDVSSSFPSALQQQQQSGAAAWSSWTPAAGSRALHVQAAPSISQQQPEQQLSRGSYEVEVAIKAYEKRYLDQASTTIRDLMLINFAPKSSSVLPEGAGSGLPEPLNLFVPVEQQRVPLNWKKTRFTVIRGPHVDKAGREQFEMRAYKAVVRAASHDPMEVQWFLDSLKLYEFPGVQVQVLLTSSSYLTPTRIGSSGSAGSSSLGGAPSTSILAAHRKQIARYLAPAAAAAGSSNAAAGAQAPAPAVPGSSSSGDMQGLLRMLRRVLHAGMQDQRRMLGGSDAYRSWHLAKKVASPDLATTPAPPETAAGAGAGADPLDVARLQQLVSVATSSDPSVSQASKAAAFLAAADAVFLSLRMDALDVHNLFPLHFTQYRVGEEVPAAQWMQAVLLAGKVAQRVQAASQEAALVEAYASHTFFSHALLYTLFKMWAQHTAGEARPHFALPSQEEVAQFMAGVAAAGRGRQAGAASAGARQ